MFSYNKLQAEESQGEEKEEGIEETEWRGGGKRLKEREWSEGGLLFDSYGTFLKTSEQRTTV